MGSTFGLIGVGGFVAPRHLQAIKDNNGSLLCALDPNDSVGILDHYFPQADFFTESERFDRHLDKLCRQGAPLDFISICSPNYLHDSHIRLALRNGASAICEKPLVLNPWNLDTLEKLQQENKQKIYTILQLRLHPSITTLKKQVQAILSQNPQKKFNIDLSYITARGKWYFHSWKGDISKSGGIATNIGIHFFDMLLWIFGPCHTNILHYSNEHTSCGYLQLESANVRWFLSINQDFIPQDQKEQGKNVFRSLLLDRETFIFSDGFTDLHTQSYQEILQGNGFGLSESKQSIALTHQIRNATPIGLVGDFHPLAIDLR